MESAHEMAFYIMQSGVHIFRNVFFVILYISFKFMLAQEYCRTVCSWWLQIYTLYFSTHHQMCSDHVAPEGSTY